MLQVHGRRGRFAAAALTATVAVLLSGCSYLGGGDAADGSVLKILVHSNAPTDAEFKKINALFEQQHPGVTVEFSTAVGATSTRCATLV